MRRAKVEVKGLAHIGFEGTVRVIELSTGEVVTELELNPSDMVQVKTTASEITDLDLMEGISITVPVKIDIEGFLDDAA